MKDDEFCKKDGQDLKELFKSQIDQVNILINANDKNYNQRFENLIQATKAALDAADRAVSKAESAAEKRFESVNEFRNTLGDQQRNLMPRKEVEIIVDGINEKFKSINEKIDNLNLIIVSRQSQSVGTREGMGTIAVIAGVISIVIGILLKFI